MLCLLRWIAVVLTISVGQSARAGEPPSGKATNQAAGIALQTVLEVEQTARFLALLLDSGRAVVNDYQALFDETGRAKKGFAPALFERQLTDMFRSRAGIDLDNLDASRIPPLAKKLMKELVETSTAVAADLQSEVTRSNGSAGVIPAIYGARVVSHFTERTGVRMKQTALVPRNAANAPDSVERAALEIFADPNYPREKVITETTARSGVLRLMFPLYATRQCLDCHGEPRGALDRTGYPREGLKLGQSAGDISVTIPITK